MSDERELVNKIIDYAADMMSSKFEYKKYYDKLQEQEMQYRTLKVQLNNPVDLKRKKIQQTSFIALPNDQGYYKTYYVYPELEQKRSEFKTLEEQINISRNKANFAHNRYIIYQNLLFVFIKNLEPDELKKIIEYLDIKNESNYTNIPSSDVLTIYKQVTFDIGILFENDIKTNISDNYKGSVTLINILIEYKKLCVDSITTYNELKEYYDNKKQELLELETLEKKNRAHYITLYRLFPTKKTKRILDKIDNKIGNLYWEDGYYLDKLYDARIKKGNIYKKYFNLVSYLDQIIDSIGEKTLKELITSLNIVIPKTDNNYFNEKEEMRKAIKNWFIHENKKIKLNVEEQTISLTPNNEEQKVLIKK